MNTDNIAPPVTVTEPATNFITLQPEKTPEEKARAAAAADKRSSAAQAVPFSWRGKQLAPFTPSREAAFHAHRSALNSPPLGDTLADSHAFSADSARMLWYLSHEPAEWLGFLASQPRGEMVAGEWRPLSAHAALEARIEKWMDETWTGTKEERTEAYVLCVDILTRSKATRPAMADPADPDELGN